MIERSVDAIEDSFPDYLNNYLKEYFCKLIITQLNAYHVHRDWLGHRGRRKEGTEMIAAR